MRRLIDADELLKAMDTWDKFGFEHTGRFVREPKDDFVTYVYYEDMLKSVNGMPTVEAIPKADYENRLKADMVAMLTEIREKAWYRHSKYEDEKDFEVDKEVEDIVNHIDAKINALKGEENVDKTQQSSL